MKPLTRTQRASGLCPRAAWHFLCGLDGRAGRARVHGRSLTSAAARERTAAIRAWAARPRWRAAARAPDRLPTDHVRWSYSGTCRCSRILLFAKGAPGPRRLSVSLQRPASSCTSAFETPSGASTRRFNGAFMRKACSRRTACFFFAEANATPSDVCFCFCHAGGRGGCRGRQRRPQYERSAYWPVNFQVNIGFITCQSSGAARGDACARAPERWFCHVHNGEIAMLSWKTM